MSNDSLPQMTTQEREVFEHYLAGGQRGDLFVNVKRGRLGIMKPNRAHGLAWAAWLAGRELARIETRSAKT